MQPLVHLGQELVIIYKLRALQRQLWAGEPQHLQVPSSLQNADRALQEHPQADVSSAQITKSDFL